jgi:hypothetical protein
MEKHVIPEIAMTVKTDSCIAHVTIIGFEKEKHQNTYNSILADILIKNYEKNSA